MPQGASIPALGLSNKAVFDEEKATPSAETEKKSLADELYKEVYFNVIDLKSKLTILFFKNYSLINQFDFYFCKNHQLKNISYKTLSGRKCKNYMVTVLSYSLLLLM